MKTILRLLTTALFGMLASAIYAQDEVPPIINYAPNTNFIAFKIKNAKELKAGLENHPLKGFLTNDKTKELLDETLGVFDKEDVDVTIKEIEKKTIDKFFTSLKGEAYFTISYKPVEVGKYDPRPKLICSIIAQVEATPFQAFIKNGTKYADKAVGQKTISAQAYESIEYTSLRVSDDLRGDAFVALVGDVGIYSNDEETLQKMIKAVVKKTNYENGLKSNEKIIAYFNANPNKEALFTADMTPLFKNELAKKDPSTSKILENMKLDKLFQVNASFDLDEKADSFDISLDNLDDGLLQFAAFINNELAPSPFIAADVNSYCRVSFSIAEFKKKMLEFVTKTAPEFKYQDFLTSAKAKFQIDLDASSESLGDDYENFSVINKEGIEESIFVNKLKNQATFASNISNLLNNAEVKKSLSPNYTIAENKEGGNQVWVFSTPTNDPNVKADKLALSLVETYAFVSMPGNLAQKNMALIKKPAEAKLSAAAPYLAARALQPAKVALFSFATSKDMVTLMKLKIKAEQAMIFKVHPSFEKILALLEESNADELKGSLSYGLWKETNKISFSAKLINK